MELVGPTPNKGLRIFRRHCGVKNTYVYNRAATVDFRQAIQPYHRCYCRRATTATSAFYFAKFRQDSCLVCLTPRGSPDT